MTRSRTRAEAPPPPLQMPATPTVLLRARSAPTSVTTMRAPELHTQQQATTTSGPTLLRQRPGSAIASRQRNAPAERVAEGHSAAVDVDLGRVQAEHARVGHPNDAER